MSVEELMLPAKIVAGCAVFVAVVVTLFADNFERMGEKAQSRLAERCAERWAPRPTQCLESQGTGWSCRVMIGGEWWPEGAVVVTGAEGDK